MLRCNINKYFFEVYVSSSVGSLLLVTKMGVTLSPASNRNVIDTSLKKTHLHVKYILIINFPRETNGSFSNYVEVHIDNCGKMLCYIVKLGFIKTT